MSGQRPPQYYAPYPDSDEDSPTAERMAPSLSTQREMFLTRPAPIAPATAGVLEYSDVSGASTFLHADESAKRVKVDTISVTSQWVADSTNRDTAAYARPTNFILHLPRTFKNITAISFNEFKMLNTFYDYSVANENITITIHEFGRTRINSTTGLPEDNVITINIHEGTYNLNTLLAELNSQLNQIPLFTSISGGYTTFAAAFQQTGDFSLNFNRPGDYLYDPVLDGPVINPLTNTAIRTPTMVQLVSRYFSTDLVPLQRNYSANDTLVAYYYPVLKEMVLRPVERAKLRRPPDGTLELTESDINAVLYTFEGLTDSTILGLIVQNRTLLDEYRSANTFINSLVNRYTVQSIDRTLRVRISATSISPSIYTALTAKQAELILQSLVASGLTTEQQRAAAREQIVVQNLVVQDMYNFMQSLFVSYLGETTNHYSTVFYSDDRATDSFIMYNGYDIPTVAKTGTSSTTLDTSVPTYVVPGIGLWTLPPDVDDIVTIRMDGTGSDTFSIVATEAAAAGGLAQLDMSGWYQDVSGQVPRTGYLVIPFTTDIARDVSIMTLPLPKAWQNPMAETASYNTTANTYVQGFLPNYETPEALADTLSIRDISNNDIGIPPDVYLASQPTIVFNSNNIIALFDISASTVDVLDPLNLGLQQPAYDLTVLIGAVDSSGSPIPLFAERLTAFFYRDRTLFQGDAGQPGLEDPLNYYETIASLDTSGEMSMIQRVVGGKHYYVLVRYTSPTDSVRPAYIKVAAISTTQRSVLYSRIPDDDATVPVQSGGAATTASPDDSQFSYNPRPTQQPTLQDISGVSNDITDYFVRTPAATRFTDPVTGYSIVSTETDTALYNNVVIGTTTRPIIDADQVVYPYVAPTLPTGQLHTMKLLERYSTHIMLGTDTVAGLGGTVTTAAVPGFVSLADIPEIHDLSGALPTAGSTLTAHSVSDVSGVLGRVFTLPSRGVFKVREIVMKSGLRSTISKGRYTLTDISGDPNLAIDELRVFNYDSIIGQTATTIAGLTPLFTMDASNCIIDISNSSIKIPSIRPLGSQDIDSGIYYRFASTSAPDLSGDFSQTNRFVAVPFASGVVKPWKFATFTDKAITPFFNSYTFPTTDTLMLITSTEVATLWSTIENAARRYSVSCKITLDVFEYYDSPLRFLGSLNATSVSGGSGVSFTDGSIYAYRNPTTGRYYTGGDSSVPNADSTDASGSGIPAVKTMLFLYDGSGNLLQDVSGGDGGVLYANESHFTAFDNNSGYETYSLIFRQRVVPDHTYYIVVRGYTPSVEFYTTVRVVGEPVVNFATRRLDDISGQLAALYDNGITDLSGTTTVSDGDIFDGEYDPTYIRNLQAMDLEFGTAADVTFGSSARGAGKTFPTISGFTSFVAQYRTEYSQLKSLTTAFSTANQAAEVGLAEYVNTYFSGVLPDQYTLRNRLTDAIPFSIKWLTPLSPAFLARTDNWGLGYNLGFRKEDTDYLISHLGAFLYKLTTETIYLRLNEELSINTMTISERENLATQNGVNGQVDRFFARILLNNFGSYTTTMLQTGRPFNPPIGKLDTMHFQLVDKNGTVLENDDCNFTATISITEQKKVANQVATIELDTGPVIRV